MRKKKRKRTVLPILFRKRGRILGAFRLHREKITYRRRYGLGEREKSRKGGGGNDCNSLSERGKCLWFYAMRRGNNMYQLVSILREGHVTGGCRGGEQTEGGERVPSSCITWGRKKKERRTFLVLINGRGENVWRRGRCGGRKETIERRGEGKLISSHCWFILDRMSIPILKGRPTWGGGGEEGYLPNGAGRWGGGVFRAAEV